MKTFFSFIVILLSGMALLSAHNNTFIETNEASAYCHEVKPSFKTGEAATYKIYYNWTAMWMSAGTVNFKVQDAQLYNKPVYHLTAIGKTDMKFNWFYKVNDQYESYIDPSNMLPLQATTKINEGSFTAENMYTFNHQKNEVLINYYKRKGVLKKQNETQNITPCSQDILSAIYYTRGFDYSKLKMGEKMNFDLYLDGKTYPIYLRYLGKENVESDLGEFRCAKFGLQLLEGEVFKGGEMTIWSTDDENRIPVLIESPLVMGSVKCYLTKVSGLKHNLSAKL
jgi:hypothetical protein